jgi:type II secretory ATPase GspE/PulE/Tfp pilus assembly ATPase PilB-like protein
MGIYELLEVSDELRRELLRRPQPDAVRNAAATLGHASLFQQGLVAVSRGDTSLPELQRVLTAAPGR